MSGKKGKISQIIGPVVDVTFKEGGDELPKIYDSLEEVIGNHPLIIQHITNNDVF